MRFWKMNGAGNDFIILNNLEEHIPEADLPRLARILCRRRLSVGADGLMVVEAPSEAGRGLKGGLFPPGSGLENKEGRESPALVPEGLFGSYTLGKPGSASALKFGASASDGARTDKSGADGKSGGESADFRMLFFNSDGSVGEMCGNGARCICRYGFETGLAGTTQRVETTAGLVTGERVDKRNYRVRLNAPSIVRTEGSVDVNGVTYGCAYVELGSPGVPHAVISYPGLREADENRLRELGRAIRWHPDFPKGANVNFYELTGPDTLYERTFERGVEDFTLACGTGTGSVVTVLTLLGKVSGQNVKADMAGGRLMIDAQVREGRVTDLYLTGPTNIVAKGEIFDEEL